MKTIVLDGVEYVPKNEVEIEKPKEVRKINITVKNRWTGAIIFESEKTTYSEAVSDFVSQKNKVGLRANLTDANLTDADLTDADLTGADLTDADLTGADLTDANLTDANLTDADLTGADLTGADLTRADLTDADLTDADLTACKYYFGLSNKNFEALCKAIKTIRWNNKKGSDFIV